MTKATKKKAIRMFLKRVENYIAHRIDYGVESSPEREILAAVSCLVFGLVQRPLPKKKRAPK